MINEVLAQITIESEETHPMLNWTSFRSAAPQRYCELTLWQLHASEGATNRVRFVWGIGDRTRTCQRSGQGGHVLGALDCIKKPLNFQKGGHAKICMIYIHSPKEWAVSDWLPKAHVHCTIRGFSFSGAFDCFTLHEHLKKGLLLVVLGDFLCGYYWFKMSVSVNIYVSSFQVEELKICQCFQNLRFQCFKFSKMASRLKRCQSLRDARVPLRMSLGRKIAIFLKVKPMRFSRLDAFLRFPTPSSPTKRK